MLLLDTTITSEQESIYIYILNLLIILIRRCYDFQLTDHYFDPE